MEFLSIIISLIGIAISSFIAYHIYYLSKRMTFKDRWQHRKNVEAKVKQLQSEIWYKNRRNKIYLVDINTYEYYPGATPNGRLSHISGGLKECYLGGVIIERHEQILLKDGNGNTQKAVKFGIIPYDWIVDIDMDGDSTNSSALIYCYFKNNKGQKDEATKYTPFKFYEYYLLNEDYKKDNNYPWEIFGIQIDLDRIQKTIQ